MCGQALLTGLDLDTSAMYWSILEFGLGFVAANLVVGYGLLAHSSSVSHLRSLSSMLFSRFSSGGKPRGWIIPISEE